MLRIFLLPVLHSILLCPRRLTSIDCIKVNPSSLSENWSSHGGSWQKTVRVRRSALGWELPRTFRLLTLHSSLEDYSLFPFASVPSDLHPLSFPTNSSNPVTSLLLLILAWLLSLSFPERKGCGEDLSAHNLFGNFSRSTGMRGRGIGEGVKALTWVSY